jgi:PAS domain S-box-containing protein
MQGEGLFSTNVDLDGSHITMKTAVKPDFIQESMVEREEDFDWEAIFNTISDAITIHDNHFNIVWANQAAEELLQLPALAIQTQKCYESYHGAGRPPIGCPSCSALLRGEPSTQEAYEPHLEKFIEIKALPRRDTENKVIGLVHIVRDMTEQKQNERAVADSERKYRELVEGTDDLVVRLDLDGRFTYVNHAAEAILGIPPGECVGLSALEFIHPKDREPTGEALSEWTAHGLTRSKLENRLVSRAGEVHHMAWTVSIHYDLKGRVTSINGIGRDMSERVRAEDEFRDMEKQLASSAADTRSISPRAGKKLWSGSAKATMGTTW